jgi:hypothetical protein
MDKDKKLPEEKPTIFEPTARIDINSLRALGGLKLQKSSHLKTIKILAVLAIVVGSSAVYLFSNNFQPEIAKTPSIELPKESISASNNPETVSPAMNMGNQYPPHPVGNQHHIQPMGNPYPMHINDQGQFHSYREPAHYNEIEDYIPPEAAPSEYEYEQGIEATEIHVE